MRFDHTFEERLRDKGYSIRCLWQAAGPEDTMIEGLECLVVQSNGHAPRIFIVTSFQGGGWDALAAVSDANDIDETVNAAEAIIARQKLEG